MNGIPNVPITTLAGVSSLTDLLPELPLPTPLPSTVNNKSLLFHPRLAEEAKRVLKNQPDDALIAQLTKALSQTSTEHIELKDPLASDAIEGDIPELLDVILRSKPNTFKSKAPALDGVDNALPTGSVVSPASAGVSPRQMAPPTFTRPQSAASAPHQSPYQSQFSPYPTPNTPNSPGRAPQPTPSPKYHQHGSPFQQQFASFAGAGSGAASAAGGPAVPAAPALFNAHTGSGPSPTALPVNGNLAASSSNSSPVSHKSLNLSPPPQKKPIQAVNIHQKPLPKSHPTKPPPAVSSPPNVTKPALQQPVVALSPCDLPRNHNNAQPKQAVQSNHDVKADLKPAPHDLKPAPISRSIMENHIPRVNNHDHVSTTPKPSKPGREPVVLLEPLNMEYMLHERHKHKKHKKDKMKTSSPVIKLLRIDDQLEDLKIKKKHGGSGDASPRNAVPHTNTNQQLSFKLSKQHLNELQHSYNTQYKDAYGRKRRRSDASYGEDPPSPVPYAQRIGEYSLSLSERVKRRRREAAPATAHDKLDDQPFVVIERTNLQYVPKKEKKRHRDKSHLSSDILTMEERTGSGSFRKFIGQLEHLFIYIEESDISAVQVDADDDDMDIPPDLLVTRSTMTELCNEAAKLKAIGVLNLVTSDKLVKLQNILLWNIRDATKLLPNVTQDEENLENHPSKKVPNKRVKTAKKSKSTKKYVNAPKVEVQKKSDSDSEYDDDEAQAYKEQATDRVLRSVESALLALYIMTSDGMPKQVYVEDVIEKVCHLAKFQLNNSIYPSYDPVYKVSTHKKDAYTSSKMKRARAGMVKHKSVILLYNKLTEVVALLSQLVNVQELTDTIILLVSSLGVAPFFVENVSELQLSAIRLVTTVFSKYEKHRSLIMEDIFASLARLPSTKRNLRSYRLNSDESVQMVTALVLQLIQSVVKLPNLDVTSHKDRGSINGGVDPTDSEITRRNKTDNEIAIVTSYEKAMRAAHNFLSVYLKKCTIKGEEDYRPLFENFIQDLLTTVNKPEWPAAELLLSLLGRLLVQHFSNKSVDMSVRVASLDYLGIVAARLRKDALSSHTNTELIDEILNEVKAEDYCDSSTDKKRSSSNPNDNEILNVREREAAPISAPLKKVEKQGKRPPNMKRKRPPMNIIYEDKDSILGESENPFESEVPFEVLIAGCKMDNNDPTQLLQKALIDYFTSNSSADPVYHFARQFYISQWYRDSNAEAARAVQSSKNVKNTSSRTASRRKSDSDQSGDDSEEEATPEMEELNKSRQVLQRAEKRKLFLISQLQILSTRNAKDATSTLDYENACLCVRHLASNRPFSHSFDIYLTQILKVLSETSVAVRTKAMKCLTAVVEVDPGILARDDMQRGVHGRFMDQSTSVREAAVELVGKFILIRPELTATYYQMLSDRILDTGISVRKRVIKIFRDICLEQAEFNKIPEMCVRMIRRVNDEEGIKKLVTEVFQTMWFTPVRQKENPQQLLRKVLNIADVVCASRDSGYEWLEQLLEGLLRKEEELHHKPVETSCRQIVNCLVENVLQLEEKSADSQRSSSPRLVACLSTLYLFSKIKPNLMTAHAMTLQPYLEIKCNTPNDHLVIHNIARILELTVPLLEHPSQSFLTQLEEDMMKLILKHGMTVLQSCVSCLGAIVNTVSHNYKLVKDCFWKFYGILTRLVAEHEKDCESPALLQHKPTLLRSLFTIGLLCCHFDFDGKEMVELNSSSSSSSSHSAKIRDRVFDVLMYFTTHRDEVVELKSLTGLGFLSIRHYEYMLGSRLREYYKHVLTWHQSVRLKCQVLKNLHQYLVEEEIKMIKADHEWRKTADKEDLKEMGDIQSGMASTVMQVYLKEVLESFFSPSVQVRAMALAVICLVLKQGLVHPVQCVPYLIAMGTDNDAKNRTKADQQLQEIDKKYPGFIHMKALSGIKMSFRLQTVLQEATYNEKLASSNQETAEDLVIPVVRGLRLEESPTGAASSTTTPTCSSLNAFLYSLVRNSRQHRRALVSSLLKMFDEDAKTSLAELLYLSDNLACYAYSCQDEPLYVMHQIDVLVSVSGSNVIQSFREYFFPEKVNENGEMAAVDDEEEDNIEILSARVDQDTADVLHELCKLSQGCILLLIIKHYLKDMYGFTDSKIHRYSPNDSSKMYDKPVNRKSAGQFEPSQTLEVLRREMPDVIDDSEKRRLAEEYLDFKYLMMSIDPADSDDEEGGQASGRGTPIGSRTPIPGAHVNAEPNAPPTTTTVPGATNTESRTAETPPTNDVEAIPHPQTTAPIPVNKMVKNLPPAYISKHSYLLEKNRSPAAKSRTPSRHHSAVSSRHKHSSAHASSAHKPVKKKKRRRRMSDSASDDDSDGASDPDWR